MFWQNFVRLCEEKGIKPTPAAAEMGFPSASVVKWKRGTIPRGTTLQKIADYFSVTVNDLLSDTPPAPSNLHREQGVKIPVLSTVGAGTPLEAINTFDQDDPDSWEEISQLEASRPIPRGCLIKSPLVQNNAKTGLSAHLATYTDFYK